MKALWIFFTLIIFCIYVLLGLYITEGIESSIQVILTWVIYTVMCTTFLNVFILGYFWSVIRNKKGPTGLRGPSGETGTVGIEGTCSIDATEAYLIKILNEYIDGLYYSKTNTHILNDDKSKLPCSYLNNKIGVTAGSRQYKIIVANLAKDNKPIINIINYLKSIWKQWFDLLYDATDTPGIWFTDEFGDEEYEWVGTNPFIEIRKYDIYYWGITRNFRPLKAEICRSLPIRDSAKIPIPDLPGKPRLKIIQSNDYYYIGNSDSGSCSWKLSCPNNAPTSWWSPNVAKYDSEQYFPVGDIMTNGNYSHTKSGKTITGDIQFDNKKIDNGPDMKTILVAGDVVDPIGFDYLQDTYGRDDSAIFGMKCPPGYESIGDVAKSGRTWIHNNQFNSYKCVPSECVEDVAESPYSEGYPNSWNKYNTWWGWRNWVVGWHDTWYGIINVLNPWYSGKLDATGDNGYNVMRNGGSKPFKKIKKSCLLPPKKDPPSTKDVGSLDSDSKDVESQNADLGIGWNGHPYKLDPKYSIFTFLNLLPEGIIVNKGSGRRFYIIHYGGEDANNYILLAYNKKTSSYNNAIQVDSNASNDGTKTRSVTRTDVRQQWIIKLQSNKKTLKLQSIYNNKYIYVGLEPKQGYSQFSTIDLDNNNYINNKHPIFSQLSQDDVDNATTFSFISSFGTNLNVIDK